MEDHPVKKTAAMLPAAELSMVFGGGRLSKHATAIEQTMLPLEEN